ncbi:MAG TPA: hypothetical protein VJ646_01050 [Candidatus Binatia bacterium]|nr:hypothetical protein [Candidatus Binatia bacterium]
MWDRICFKGKKGDNSKLAVITTHADIVGSLLRPAELLAAQKRLAAGTITAVEFKEIQDRAVDEAIALQESVGLEVVTDGEMRRQSFQSQMTSAVSGFGEFDLDAFLWGEWYDEQGMHRTPRPRRLGATSKLRRRRYLSADEFVYLKDRTRRAPKITLPSPSLWVNFWSAKHSKPVYPTLDSFLADIVAILRDEVAELARLGASYIQIDAPHYGLLLDPSTRGFYEKQGWSLDRWLGRGIELDNAVMEGFPRVTFGFHI